MLNACDAKTGAEFFPFMPTPMDTPGTLMRRMSFVMRLHSSRNCGFLMELSAEVLFYLLLSRAFHPCGLVFWLFIFERVLCEA